MTCCVDNAQMCPFFCFFKRVLAVTFNGIMSIDSEDSQQPEVCDFEACQTSRA